ncbi:PilN domain-containing protein [Candidatus Poribacteria bacterium]|nr:PilN domain-containing protein [Candidatus Poribacteria bacterium]
MKVVEVNLLPPEYAPESPYSVRNIIILLLSFLILGFLILIALQLVALKERYVAENVRLVTAINAFKKEKGKLDSLLERKSELEKRFEMVREALGRRRTWADKLTDIWRAIPDGIWLQGIYLRGVESQGIPSLRISASALDLGRIEKFIRRLKRSPYFKGVISISVNRQTTSGGGFYNFELKLPLKEDSTGQLPLTR